MKTEQRLIIIFSFFGNDKQSVFFYWILKEKHHHATMHLQYFKREELPNFSAHLDTDTHTDTYIFA